MKLMKFIGESVSTHDTDENIADMLHKECSDFFKETGGMRLFRGTKKNIPIFEKVHPRQDRQPKDTPQEVHEYLDREFQKRFGWKVRSEGVFVSPQSEQTEHYGYPYWFLPCNGYKYVYSPTIGDILSELEDNDLISSFSGKYRTQTLWDYPERRDEIIKNIMKSYKSNDIRKMMGQGYEISFNCPKGYYLLNTSWIADSNTRYFTIYGGH